MVEQSDFCRFIAVAFHAVWLVDDDEMLVLIELLDQMRLASGEFFFWIILFVKGQLNAVTRLDQSLPMDGLTVNQNVFLGSEKVPNLSWDEQLVF